MIDFLISEMKKYMEANQSDYPLYFSDTDSRENTKDPNRRDYNYGFSIGKVEGDCVKYGIGHPIN